jgi:hypothetical protein
MRIFEPTPLGTGARQAGPEEAKMTTTWDDVRVPLALILMLLAGALAGTWQTVQVYSDLPQCRTAQTLPSPQLPAADGPRSFAAR